MRVLADALRFDNRPKACVAVLEGFAELLGVDYSNPTQLQTTLTTFTQRLEDNNAASYVCVLADALRFDNQIEQAIAVLETWSRNFTILEESELPIAVGNVSLLVQTRIRCGFANVEDGAKLVERFIEWIRRTLLVVDPTNKAQLMKNIRNTRRAIIQFADVQSRTQRIPQAREQWRKRGLLWDAWLSQRVLMERMLMGRQMVVGLDSPDLQPPASWPYASDERPQWRGHRPEKWEIVPSRNCLLDAVSAPLSGDERTASIPTQFTRRTHLEPWQQKAKSVAQRPLDEGQMARDLGANTVLIRAGFVEGQLHWTAWIAEGETLQLLAEESRQGEPTDQRNLALAHAFHDLRTALAFVTEPQSRKVIEFTIAHVAFTNDCDVNAVFNKLAAAFNLLASDSAAMRVWKTLVGVLRTVASNSDGNPRHALAEVWPTVQLSVRDTFAKLEADWLQTVNDATKQLIADCNAIWNLDPLVGILTDKHDVMLVADEVLYAVPFAFLRVGDTPLYEVVRSARCSLSPLLDRMQTEIESTATAETREQIAGAAWFNRDDSARSSGVEFLHGLTELAAEAKCNIHFAADAPEANWNWLLSQMTELGSARLWCWIGHGHETEAGIMVGPTPGFPCRGEGMPLEQFELLLIIACSLGRHQTTGAIDAESFCCDLTLNGGRSAIAARWPIIGSLAAHIGCEIAKEYLALRNTNNVTGPELTKSRLRAVAFNNARKAIAKDERYLNTLAAFDLWGLA